MVAVTIGGSIIMALALLLSLVRGVERGLLLGICVGGSGARRARGRRGLAFARERLRGGRRSLPLRIKIPASQPGVPERPANPDSPSLPQTPTDKRPEPWLFRGYQVVAAILNALVWLLLAATVGVVAAALISWGGFAAVSRGIDAGVSAADVVLSPAGVTLSSASDLSARVASALGGSPLAALVAGGGAGSGLPFTPVCAPVCLNAGSFAAVLRMAESCVCGGARLDAARAAAGRGAKAAGAALGGSLAIWISASLLTLILTGHHVTAGFDRKSARYLKEQRAEEYDMGYAANPKDCVIVADAAAAGGGDAGAGADQTPTLRIIKQRAAAGGV